MLLLFLKNKEIKTCYFPLNCNDVCTAVKGQNSVLIQSTRTPITTNNHIYLLYKMLLITHIVWPFHKHISKQPGTSEAILITIRLHKTEQSIIPNTFEQTTESF